MTTFWDGWLSSESSDQDAIKVKRIYIELNDGNAYDAILFSQIMYWHGFSRETGRPRMTIEREGHRWLAKAYEDWHAECGIQADVARKAIARMVRRGLLIKRVWKFNGSPTTHIRVDPEHFEVAIRNARNARTICYNVSEPSATTYQNHLLQRSDSLTETTAETTAEEINAPLGAPILNAGAQNGDDSFMTILLPANHPVFDEPERIAKYPCVPADVNALITAWWNWVPVRPSKRGKVIPAKAHYANTENRAYARSLVERGVLPSDFALLLGDIRSNPDSRWAHLKGKELTFCYVAPIVEEWVREDREENWYTEVQPRVTPMRPDVVIRLGDIEDGQALERLNHHPDCYIDVPKPYLSPQDVATEEDDESFDPDTATDAELLASFGEPL